MRLRTHHPYPLPSVWAAMLAALLLVVTGGLPNGVRLAHAQGNIIYVDHDANGANDGSSWEDAYTALQDALLDTPPDSEIWVAAGVYYPDVGSTVDPDDRQATFTLQNGIALYGGFAGNEDELIERDWEANLTILSGDIDQDDAADLDGVVRNTDVISGSNAYHVVSGNLVNSTARLDGFTITAGNANGGIVGECGPHCGGGLDATAGDPMLANLVFSGNHAGYGGAGAFFSGGDPTLSNVTFSYNRADVYGGGLYLYEESNAFLSNATFHANSAGNYVTGEGGGGGMALYESIPYLTHASFVYNVAARGGGMHNRISHPQMQEVTFTGNYALAASHSGGAIYNEGGDPLVVNGNFTGNRASGGGAVYHIDGNATFINTRFAGNYGGLGGAISSRGVSFVNFYNVTFSGNQAISTSAVYGSANASVSLYNVIVWGNRATNGLHLDVPPANRTLESSLVEGMSPGGSNLDGIPANDPAFVRAVACGDDGCTDNPPTPADEAANDDYGDLRLRANSPVVDVGNNNLVALDGLDLDNDLKLDEKLPLDLDRQPRVAAVKSTTATVDFGAYERVNAPPAAHAGGPYSGDEGSPVSLDGAASTDESAIVAYGWDCTNDGSIDASTASPTGSSCTYVDDGVYTLRLAATDNLSATGAATTSVTIANIAPTLDAPPNQSTTARTAKSFNLGSATDPGLEAGWTVSVDWGDTPPASEFTVATIESLSRSHTYAAAGTYNVVVTLSDGDDEDDAGFQVIVNPAPPGAPVVTAAADQTSTAGVGQSFALGSFSDSDSSGPWQVTVNWGDGGAATGFAANAAGTLAAQAHTYATAAEVEVLVTVSDGALASSAVFQVTVSAGAPENGSVAGLIFDDANGNGVQNSGEAGIAGAAVTLTDENAGAEGASAALVRSATSAGNGTYRFDNVPPGDYTVIVSPPPGHTVIGPTQRSVTVGAGEISTVPGFNVHPEEGGGETLYLPALQH